jgi:hypothetical protein
MADDQSADDASVKVGQTAAKKKKPAAKHTSKKRVKNKKSKTIGRPSKRIYPSKA